MNALALVATLDGLLARITTVEQAGIDELLIQPVIDPPTEIAQFAKLPLGEPAGRAHPTVRHVETWNPCR